MNPAICAPGASASPMRARYNCHDLRPGRARAGAAHEARGDAESRCDGSTLHTIRFAMVRSPTARRVEAASATMRRVALHGRSGSHPAAFRWARARWTAAHGASRELDEECPAVSLQRAPADVTAAIEADDRWRGTRIGHGVRVGHQPAAPRGHLVATPTGHLDISNRLRSVSERSKSGIAAGVRRDSSRARRRRLTGLVNGSASGSTPDTRLRSIVRRSRREGRARRLTAARRARALLGPCLPGGGADRGRMDQCSWWSCRCLCGLEPQSGLFVLPATPSLRRCLPSTRAV